MKPFHVLVCLAVGALLGMSATTVYATLEWREERCARAEALVAAFDAYTDALVASSQDQGPHAGRAAPPRRTGRPLPRRPRRAPGAAGPHELLTPVPDPEVVTDG